MRLNTLSPASGAKKKAKRVGRGIGSGSGKTCGRGHKGQASRSGYSAKTGFEGGQMPLQRRIPKSGFTSRKSKEIAEIPLGVLQKVTMESVNLVALKEANLISNNIKRAKIILSGSIDKPIVISGIKVTAGARKAIEAVGGKVE